MNQKADYHLLSLPHDQKKRSRKFPFHCIWLQFSVAWLSLVNFISWHIFWPFPQKASRGSCTFSSDKSEKNRSRKHVQRPRRTILVLVILNYVGSTQNGYGFHELQCKIAVSVFERRSRNILLTRLTDESSKYFKEFTARSKVLEN